MFTGVSGVILESFITHGPAPVRVSFPVAYPELLPNQNATILKSIVSPALSDTRVILPQIVVLVMIPAG